MSGHVCVLKNQGKYVGIIFLKKKTNKNTRFRMLLYKMFVFEVAFNRFSEFI